MASREGRRKPSWVLICVFATVCLSALPLSGETLLPSARVRRSFSRTPTTTSTTSTTSNTSPPPSPSQPAGAPISLLSACDAEVRRLCPAQPAPLRCLLHSFLRLRQGDGTPQRRPNVFTEACSKWLWAREECVSFVRIAGNCRATETARECLRRFPPRLLPEGCRATEYYRSVMLYGEMKRRQKTKP